MINQQSFKKIIKLKSSRHFKGRLVATEKNDKGPTQLCITLIIIFRTDKKK
jgi:hypothetical protein